MYNYNVLQLWPSFEHFNSTRQMASHVDGIVHSAACRQFLTAANASRTTRTLMKKISVLT